MDDAILSLQKDSLSCLCVANDTPSVTLTSACWMGIDEAGRGPVLGPMVYGACYSPIASKAQFQEMGFADSKTLTEEQREALFSAIEAASDSVGWLVHVLSPTHISNSMLRRVKYNLNEMSHDTAIGLIRKVLQAGVNLQEVYVDTVGDPAKYQAKLKELFPQLDITVAKKADSTYSIVSAASICAKVARDRALKAWTFVEGLQVTNYGSGYPGDPETKKFLETCFEPLFGFPQFVRFSWSTASVIIDKKAVPVQWEDDDAVEGEGHPAKGCKSITSFFNSSSDAGSHGNGGRPVAKRHKFFSERCLDTVIEF